MDKTKDGLILFAACLAAYMFSLNYNGLIQPFLMNLVEPTLRYYFIFETALSAIFIFLIGMAAIRFMSKKYAVLLAPVFLAGAGAKFVKSWAWISEVASILFTDFRTFQTSSRLMDDAPYALNLGIYCLFWFFVLLISIRQSIYLIRWSFHASQDQSDDKEQYRAKSGLFGDARFGKWSEIKKVVNSSASGVVVGEDYDPRKNKHRFTTDDKDTWGQGGKADLIRMDGNFESGHILVFGASGSGKTASYIVPTCLDYMKSLIVVDPGPAKTAINVSRKRREENGRKIIEIGDAGGIDVMALLAPFLTDSEQYYELAKLMIIEKRNDRFDKFYTDKACNVLAALLQYYHRDKQTDPFKEIADFFGLDRDSMMVRISEIISDTKSSVVKRLLNPFVKADAEFFGYLLAVADTSLKWMLYEKKLDLVNNRAGNLTKRAPEMDLFITLSLDEIASYPALLKLILGTFTLIQFNGSQKDEDIIETFMIVDEAPHLKYFPLFEKLRDLGRKPKMRMMLMYQSPAQMLNDDAFGPSALTEWSTVALTAYSGVDDVEEAERLAKIFGEMTVTHTEQNSSHSGDAGSMMSKSNNLGTSTRTQGVSLIQPAELMSLPKDAQILKFRNMEPFICGKAMYFRRAEWTRDDATHQKKWWNKWASPHRYGYRPDIAEVPWYIQDVLLMLSVVTDLFKPKPVIAHTAAADAYERLEQKYIEWDDRQYAIFKAGGKPHPSWTEEQDYFARLAEHADENGTVPIFDKAGNLIP